MATRFDDWEGDFLAHYGVLGMKWGQRRFQNKDGSLTAAGEKRYAKTGEYGYQYHSHSTKKYQRKVRKAEEKTKNLNSKYIDAIFDKGPTSKKAEKINHKNIKNSLKKEKYAQRAKRSAELDRLEQEGAKNVSVGKALVTRLLLGGEYSKAYQQNLAKLGTHSGKATTGEKVTAAVKSGVQTYLLGKIGRYATKASYIRQDEKKGRVTIGDELRAGDKIMARSIDKGRYVPSEARKEMNRELEEARKRRGVKRG